MNKSPAQQSHHEKNAQSYFAKTEQGEAPAKQSRKKERTATAVKTAKLRDMRLAKEAADKVEADKLTADGAKPTAKKTARAARPAKRTVVRMIY